MLKITIEVVENKNKDSCNVTLKAPKDITKGKFDKQGKIMDKKEYKSAIEMLYPKLTDFPENIEIITQIANCYSSMGEKEQAEQEKNNQEQ